MKLRELIPSTRIMLERLAEYGGVVLIVKGLSTIGGRYLNHNGDSDVLFGAEEFDYAEHEGLLTKEMTSTSTYKYSITAKGRAFAEQLTPEEALLQSAIGSNQGEVNLNIQRFEGLLNTGSMNNIGNLNVNIRGLRERGQQELADALDKLSNAVKEDNSLGEEAKAESLERIEHIASALAKEENSRPAKFQLKDTLKGLAEVIKTSASCTTVWHYTCPIVSTALGL